MKDNFGAVLFYDAGYVYKKNLPNLKQKLLSGAGVGLRYHSPIGPFRFDIATPLNPRGKFDKKIHLYFGIGQNF